jgi:Putative phage metallopeptidase
MSNVEYSEDVDLTAAVNKMVADSLITEFKPLRDLHIVIKPCLRVRLDKDGQTQPCKGIPVKLKRVSPIERLFIRDRAHFILVVDYHAWETGNEKSRGALIHHALMQIAAEKSEDGIKISTRKPDIVEFTATVERFGAFSDVLLNLREAFRRSPSRLMPVSEPHVEKPVDTE